MIVLDTDVISELMRPRPSAALLTRLAEVPAEQQATTSVTIGELAYGACRVNRPELYERALSLISTARIIPFDREAAERYGIIRSELERHGQRLADPDLRIAAVTLASEGTLISGNQRHFARVPGLTTENWIR